MNNETEQTVTDALPERDTTKTAEQEGVYEFAWSNTKSGHILMNRRLVYATKGHALIAARHIFGLKGGEL